MASAAWPWLSLTDTFRKGSDISLNYPILFGIKADKVTERASSSKAVALHEVRALDPLKLSDSITHLEAPRSRIKETEEMPASNGLDHPPVLALEDCEAYLSLHHVWDVFAQKLDSFRKQKPPYTITNPLVLNLSSKRVENLTPSKEPGYRFPWSPDVVYSSSLIPAHKDVFLNDGKPGKKKDAWATPGGYCDSKKDINPLSAAIRNTQEEIGFMPAGEVVLQPPIETAPGSKNCFFGYLWLVGDETLRPISSLEHCRAKWVLLSEIEPPSRSSRENAQAH